MTWGPPLAALGSGAWHGQSTHLGERRRRHRLGGAGTAFRMKRWGVADDELRPIRRTTLHYEERVEDWIAREPLILGMDVLLIGRQVTAEFGGRVDLLGIDRQGDLVVIELKRAKTPREIVARVLQYASRVSRLNVEKIHTISSEYPDRSLAIPFSERFDTALLDSINGYYSTVIVASTLDEASERIVHYLTESIGSHQFAHFTLFGGDQQEYLGRAWLQGPGQVEGTSHRRLWRHWSVNVRRGEHRNRDDNRKYGFIKAGQGEQVSGDLGRLSLGDKIFAKMRDRGYVG